MKLLKFNEKEDGSYAFVLLGNDGTKLSLCVPTLPTSVKEKWAWVRDLFAELQNTKPPITAQMAGFSISFKEVESVSIDAFVSSGGVVYKAKSENIVINLHYEGATKYDNYFVEMYDYIKTTFSDSIIDNIDLMLQTNQLKIFSN
jgi:hypothetical protein